MNKQELSTWLTNLAKRRVESVKDAVSNGFFPQAISQIGPDEKNYDVHIYFYTNNKVYSHFMTTQETFDDCIKLYMDDKKEFTDPDKYFFNEDILAKLIDEIEKKLKLKGNYKIKLIGNNDFDLVQINS